MCHRHSIAEREPLRERIDEEEAEFGHDDAFEADEPELEEEKPAIPTPSDD